MSIRLLRSAILAALALAPALTPLLAADQPPGNLHWTGDHWTAWELPAAAPEGAKVHVVKPGDTFWALAKQNLGNPYLWPQLWEKNQYVLDAHWIYPGDPLLLDVAVQPAADAATTAEATPTGDTGAEAGATTPAEPIAVTAAEAPVEDPLAGMLAPAAGGAPTPLGYEDDIYCSGYIGDEEQTFSFTLTGSEYESLSPALQRKPGKRTEGVFGAIDTVKYRLDLGDIVYLDGGRAAGLEPGAELTAVAPANKVRHPLTRKVVGTLYEYLGRVRVLSVQESSAIAEIVHSCAGMTVGARLVPFEPEPVPLARRTGLRPINDPSPAESLKEAPTILWAHQGAVSIAQDQLVFVDRGSEENVSPGDLFTIYRENREGFPPVVLGELAVLSVRRHTAIARVLESRFPIYVGDRLEVK
ncbi:MAG: LysM peptidoglycan-binding domain-containing protein [Holophagales bacterium]|nr:MAG: LysM peptidoglycan-binding domain-containing protein [Holophagales bacterium]